MIKKQQFIVIGLGVFGATIARELTRLGHEVLGIDSDEQRVDRLAEDITHAVIADVTDENSLPALNAGSYDAAVVAIGRNVEATGARSHKSMGQGTDEPASPNSPATGGHADHRTRA